jgi:acyl-coenzyme A synthetase/AMP-(fatty) acid ligase
VAQYTDQADLGSGLGFGLWPLGLCAVVGAADSDGLTKPKAFVVLRSGVGPTHDTARDIQAFVKASIAPYKYPRWIEIHPRAAEDGDRQIQRFRLR